ncbi:MAG: 30S ribosomal protein S2 [Planctomycetota bacterium]|nr:MAG: 30S ribosomal protein S2 [Planctomycetota bacterium]
MLDAGIHFGHHTSRWNPKMKPFIYGSRNSIHIIDIRETVRGLLRAQRFLANVVSRGQDVLFVGTKRQAREAVREAAERCGMHYVSERWLGGTLTNFRTIRSRLQRLEELEALMQSPEWETGYSKKMKSTLSRELKKIQRNLTGIRNMTRPPGALVVIDVRKEHNALREARALRIPTVCLIDTDSDPDQVSIPIPGNDDAMRAIQIIVNHLADAVEEGKRARPAPSEAGGETENAPRRRARRDAPVGRAPSGPAPVVADEGSVGGVNVADSPPNEPVSGDAVDEPDAAPTSARD